jgi:PTS system fructose-specific IIC component
MRTLDLRRSVLIGVSYMIPFVVVGGILQAAGLLLGGRDLARDPAGVIAGALLDAPHHTAAILYTLGSLSFFLLAPVLAGAIAYAIAARPGLMPGVATGLAAGVVGAGFLGALIGGVLAGIGAELLGRVRLPESMRGLASFLLVPLTVTLVSGSAMLALIGPAVAAAERAVGTWLTGLGGLSAVLLGAVLGAMIVADLGGPLNKAAYTFAVAGVTGTGVHDDRALSVMAAVMAAGMAAPLACWLATVAQPSLFRAEERRNGKAAGVLGALFISEGAIPFAAAAPLVAIPSLMLGGAVAGAASMAFGTTLSVPHGGVLALVAVGHLAGFLGALTLGTGLGAAGLVVARLRRRARPDEDGEMTVPAAQPAAGDARPADPDRLSNPTA